MAPVATLQPSALHNSVFRSLVSTSGKTQLVAQHPDHAATTLVYTSTRDDVIERSRAQAAGIDCFLAKPFSAEELWAIVGGTADKAA